MKFREWCAQLSIVLRDEGNEDSNYDVKLARNYCRNDYSPREFYREIIVGGGGERLSRYELGL